MNRKSLSRALGLAASWVLTAWTGVAAASINIQTVTVGDPGNAADTTGYGRVTYAYNIGKYEVTAGQYTAMLNAVATTDTYALYNTEMSRTDWGSGIVRSGSAGSYAYSVDSAFINRPVNFVSFWDACRFANWLSNGQPTGGQDASTTENGAYTLSGYNGTGGKTIKRNANALWALPTEDEWYKAAYYKGGSTSAGYWAYPTRSDTGPGWDITDALPGNNANFYYNPGYPIEPIDNGKYTTIAGQFQNSPGPYGTFDQCGNVGEWNEAVPIFSYRGQRGGSYTTMINDQLRASIRGYGSPTDETDPVGFRVVLVPEPSCLGFISLGVAWMLVRQRRDMMRRPRSIPA